MLSLHPGDPPGGCCPCILGPSWWVLSLHPGDPPRGCCPCSAVTLPGGWAVAAPEGCCDTRGSLALAGGDLDVPPPHPTPPHRTHGTPPRAEGTSTHPRQQTLLPAPGSPLAQGPAGLCTRVCKTPSVSWELLVCGVPRHQHPRAPCAQQLGVPGAVASPSPCPVPALGATFRRRGQMSSGCGELSVLSCPPVLVLMPPGARAPAVPQAACHVAWVGISAAQGPRSGSDTSKAPAWHRGIP